MNCAIKKIKILKYKLSLNRILTSLIWLMIQYFIWSIPEKKNENEFIIERHGLIKYGNIYWTL